MVYHKYIDTSCIFLYALIDERKGLEHKLQSDHVNKRFNNMALNISTIMIYNCPPRAGSMSPL